MTYISTLVTQIRELLPKVTPGPWDVWCEQTPSRYDAIAEFAEQVQLTEPFIGETVLLNAGGKCPASTGCGPTSKVNAAYIALLNPVTVTALLDRIEELERELTDLQTVNQCYTEDFAAMKKRAETAESRVAEAGAEALEPIIAEIKKLKTNFGMAAYVSGYKDGRNDALSIVEEAAAALKSGGANG